DDEGWLEGHGPGHIVEVGRSRHHGFVDLDELLPGAATLDADDVAEFVVARWHGWIDSEEAAQVDFTMSLDLQLFQRNSPQCALRRVPDHHAGIERRQEIFLRIGEAVRSAQFVGLVDINRKLARYARAADLEAIDTRATPCLALPGRSDAPACLAL